MRNPVSSCWSGEVQETPKAIIVALGYTPEVEGKPLLLKIPCTSEAGPRGSKPDVKASSSRTVFPRTRWCYARYQEREATNSSTQLWSLWITAGMTRQPRRWNSGIHILSVASAVWLDLPSSQQNGNHAPYWKPNQQPRPSVTMDLKGEPTTTLLKQHLSWLHSKYLSLYP